MRHDLYHLPEYLDFAARYEDPGSPLAFVADDGRHQMLIPLIVRDVPAAGSLENGWSDAISPRGYAGPVTNAPSDQSTFMESAVSHFITALLDRHIVSAFIRLHPLIGVPIEALRPRGAIVDSGDTVAIDLSLGPEAFWAQTRQNHRRNINRALRNGYRTRTDDAWERLDDFTIAYGASMERLGAPPRWRLDAAYFEALRAELGSRVHLRVAELDGEFAAGALLTEVDGIVEYHYAATAEEHVAASPSKLIVRDLVAWAHERGDRVLHLAGSTSRGDSLSHFKRGFSPVTQAVHSWRLVSDVPMYDDLVNARSKQAVTAPGFFPAYRAPDVA